MKHGTDRLLKYKLLKKQLRMGDWQVKGILQALWDFCADNSPRGDIGRFSDSQILAGIEYDGDGPKLISALVDNGWLDRDRRHRLVVHDWEEHCEGWLKKRMSRQKITFVQKTDRTEKTEDKPSVADSGGQCPTNLPTRQPMASIPNPSPSPIPIPPTPPRGAAGGRAIKPSETQPPEPAEAKVKPECPPGLPDEVEALVRLFNRNLMPDWVHCDGLYGDDLANAVACVRQIPDFDQWQDMFDWMKRRPWWKRIKRKFHLSLPWIVDQLPDKNGKTALQRILDDMAGRGPADDAGDEPDLESMTHAEREALMTRMASR